MGITTKPGGKIVGGKLQVAGVTGAVTGTGVTVIEGMGEIHQSVFNLSGTAMTGTDNSIMYYSQKLYTCPLGSILILGGTADFTLVGSGGVKTSSTGDWGAGTITADTGGGMSGHDVDIIPSTAYTLSSYEVDCAAGNTAIINSGAPFDGHSTATTFWFNSITDNGGFTTTGTLTVTGTVTITWVNLGDF